MAEKKQPNEVDDIKKQHTTSKSSLPNAINDPQIMLRLRKKRHMSGLMCPPNSFLPVAPPDPRKEH
ncbi:MAG: hypothetical protein QNJ29_12035 [Rhizobiaceae bacterium]|nr:hypothetical protein [Rhizobiaceae bacterium]